MRWPWSKPSPEQIARLREAEAAKKAAEAERDRVVRQWPAVHEARARLDGLGVSIEKAMRGNQ